MKLRQFKQISGFSHNVAKQSNTRHLAWMRHFSDRMATDITQAFGDDTPSLLAQAIDQLDQTVRYEELCYRLPSLKPMSAELRTIDRLRGQKYMAAKSMARGLTRLGSEQQRDYAQQLLLLMSHYQVNVREHYVVETTKLNKLIQHLQSDGWEQRLNVLGLKDTFDELKLANQRMADLISQRNDQMVRFPRQSLLQARAASDEAYALCVMLINSFANTTWHDGQSPYDTCIDHINTDQYYYHIRVFPRAAADDEDEDNGDDDAPSDDGR